MAIFAGGGYAKLIERQGSEELLDPGMVPASKVSPDDEEEAPVSEPSSTTPGRQSVGLLAGTARFMLRAVATADRYKQFVDADVDAESAPITSSDCDAEGHSDDADETMVGQSDFQYTELDDTGHHSSKLSVPAVFTATTTTTTFATHQSLFQTSTNHDKRAVRQRPVKPDFATHTSVSNPFGLAKISLPFSGEAGSANVVSFGQDAADVFGAAPFRRKVADTKIEAADNVGEVDVFANVPFSRQQERTGKAVSSISPPTTSSNVVAPVSCSALTSNSGSYNTFVVTESFNTGGVYITQSAPFHQSSSGPTSAAFVPAECFSANSHMNVVGTMPYAVQPYATVYARRDSGPLLASFTLPVVAEQDSSYNSAVPADAGQSMHEEPQATEECHGSLKRSWLSKLRSEKESPTTAVANLGFADDPDALLPPFAAPLATEMSFHGDMLDAIAEPKSPVIASESNFLLPSGEGSHTLPKVGAKKHLSHQHHMPLVPPETDSFTVAKKGIALL